MELTRPSAFSSLHSSQLALLEELLQSIQPGMKLDKAFFLKIYGYEISFPGLRDTAIKALEDAGCSRAKEYYIAAVAGYKWEYRQQFQAAGAWYLAECEKQWKKRVKEGEKKRKKQELKQYLAKKSDRELLNLLQMLS